MSMASCAMRTYLQPLFAYRDCMRIGGYIRKQVNCLSPSDIRLGALHSKLECSIARSIVATRMTCPNSLARRLFTAGVSRYSGSSVTPDVHMSTRTRALGQFMHLPGEVGNVAISNEASSHGKLNDERSSWLYVVVLRVKIAPNNSSMCNNQKVRRAHSRSNNRVFRASADCRSDAETGGEFEGPSRGCRIRKACSVLWKLYSQDARNGRGKNMSLP